MSTQKRRSNAAALPLVKKLSNVGILVVLFLVIGCRQKKQYHDTSTSSLINTTEGAIAAILKYQKGQNELFRDPDKSPLPDRYRKSFQQLDFYEPDTTFIVKASLTRILNAMPFSMPTNTSRTTEEMLYGTLKFNLKGETHTLEVYQNSELKMDRMLFLPFSDKTNGITTYPGGRYLDLKVPKGTLVVLDFNKAYNPYCAYNKKYSCPLVPKANSLTIKVEAGVRAFKK